MQVVSAHAILFLLKTKKKVRRCKSDSCTPSQCLSCSRCAATAYSHADCAQQLSDSGRCVNPDETSKCNSHLRKCATEGIACFHNLKCHDPCVCNDWKKENCNGLKYRTAMEPYNRAECKILMREIMERTQVESNLVAIVRSRQTRNDSMLDRDDLDGATSGKCAE